MTAWTKSIFLVQRRMDKRDHQFDSETKIQDFNEVALTMYRKFLNQPDTKQLKQNARALMKRYKVYLQENKGMSLVNDVDRILREYAILHCGIISWMDNNGYTVDFDIDESLFQYVVAVCLPEVIRLSAKSNEPKAQDWMLAWTVYLVISNSVFCLCVNVPFSPPLSWWGSLFTFLM